MKNERVWQKYAGKVAWPTILLFAALLLGYGILWYAFNSGLSGVWTSCIGAVFAYGMFTIAHEASHGNISGGVKSVVVFETILGWLSSMFLLFPFCAFKVIHLRHHAHTNDPVKDPDHYVNGKNAFTIFIRCLTLIGHYFGLTLGKDSKKDPAMQLIRKQSIGFSVSMLLGITFLIVSGYGPALFYVFILSALMAAPVLAFAFDWIPHYPHNNLDKYHNTRVITIPGLEFLSLYQSYHLMHHLYPRVPFYHYKDCFQDYEKELLAEKSPIEGFRTQDLGLMQKRNTYVDVISGKSWSFVLEVENVFKETHDSLKITFKNLDDIPFTFKSGQYVVLSDYVEGRLVSRCYSICENPSTGKLSVIVKRVHKGKLSNHLVDQVKENYKLKVSGPYGSFILPKERHQPLLLVAGGSGITPILSILKCYLETSDAHITLLYGCKSKNDIIARQELDNLSSAYTDRFSYIVDFDILDEKKQKDYLKNISLASLCYICGPQPMMAASKKVLSNLGIPQECIKTEEFASATKELTGVLHEIEVSIHQHELLFDSDTSETILESAIRAKKEIPYACAMGQCGTCKVKLIEGEVTWKNEDEIALLCNEKEQGYILPCVCSATTKVRLKV